MKAATGSSNVADAHAAGVAAAREVVAQLPAPKVAFVYASVDYDLPALVAGIHEVLPDTYLVGNTSFTGVVTQDGYCTGGDGFVGIMGLDDPDMVVGSAGLVKSGTARETGREAAKQAMAAAGRKDAPSFIYVATAPGEEEYYFKGISDVIGRVPLFGGSAADNTITGLWSLLSGTDVFPEGVVTAFFYTDKAMTNLFTGAFRETEDVGLITKVDGDRTLVEIDGVPAMRKYAEWRGLNPDDLMGGALLAATIVSPLGVKDRLGELIAIRHPMNGNEDYSMNLGSKVSEKTAVIRMEASVDELIETAGSTLATLRDSLPTKPACYHLVHCGGRRAGIDSRIEEAVAAIKGAAGDVPFIVEFTFGEYGFEDDGNNTMGGLMLSYTAIAE